MNRTLVVVLDHRAAKTSAGVKFWPQHQGPRVRGQFVHPHSPLRTRDGANTRKNTNPRPWEIITGVPISLHCLPSH